MRNYASPQSAEFKKVLAWVKQAQAIAPQLCDWIGIYFKESFLLKNTSTDLVIGPYVGEVTEHVRIPISKGMCGLALREERVVNVPDVRAEADHIACSLKTRSELVIPLKDKTGVYVAELDIDSNTLNAFTPDLETRFKRFAEGFADLLS